MFRNKRGSLRVEELERRVVPAASHPPTVPAFEDGETVQFKMNNPNVIGVDHGALEEKVAIPLYAFGTPGSQLQPDILSARPGEPGYRPWWEVFQVVVNDGRDLSTNPYTSEEELLQAAAAGKVTITETDFIFLCQVLPGVGKNR